jgi:hypothetical protein
MQGKGVSAGRMHKTQVMLILFIYLEIEISHTSLHN